MTDTRNTTCEERIDGELASTIADLKGFRDTMANANGQDNDDAFDEAQEEMDNYALCLDLKTTMIVQLSTGGPGDQLEIAVEKGQHGWELADDHATYRFLDWFDGATRRTDDPDIMGYLENMVERLSY